MNKNLISGVVLLAIAGIYYTWSTQIADSTLSDEVGAGGLPQVLSIILAALAIIMIVRALLVSPVRAAAVGSDDEERDAPIPRAVGFLLFGAAYIFLVPFVGYIVATALMIGAVALYEGAPRTWVVIAISVGGGVFYWAVFVKLLGVHQPMGSIFQGLF